MTLLDSSSSGELVVPPAKGASRRTGGAVGRRRPATVIPWTYLLISTVMLAMLMVLVLCQRAQLVSHQYTLVELKQARSRALKERAELRLTIQGLSALDRVDGMSRVRLGMIAPAQRLILDLGQPRQASSGAMVAVKKVERP